MLGDERRGGGRGPHPYHDDDPRARRPWDADERSYAGRRGCRAGQGSAQWVVCAGRFTAAPIVWWALRFQRRSGACSPASAQPTLFPPAGESPEFSCCGYLANPAGPPEDGPYRGGRYFDRYNDRPGPYDRPPYERYHGHYDERGPPGAPCSRAAARCFGAVGCYCLWREAVVEGRWDRKAAGLVLMSGGRAVVLVPACSLPAHPHSTPLTQTRCTTLPAPTRRPLRAL